MHRHIAFFALPLLLFAACQNDPDSTVVGIIPNEDLIGAVRFDSQRDSSLINGDEYNLSITAAASTILSIGQAEDYDASALIRWLYLADTVGGGGRIVSARIRLHSLPYGIGATGPTTLELHEITSFWSSFTFTKDSLKGLGFGSAVVGSATRTLAGNDSIDIDVDTTLIRDWLVKANANLYFEIRGVLVQASVTGNVRAFHSAEGSLPPTLEIVLENNGKLDTIRGENLEDTYVTKGPVSSEPQRLLLQGGTARRGRLFFNVDAIPSASIVNHVSLYLRMDKNISTEYYRGIDSLIVYSNLDSATNKLSSTGIVTRLDGTDPSLLIAEGGVLLQAVQNWVNRKENNGLILVKAAEVSDLDRLAIYAADAPADQRPRLVVTYTSQP